jgi:hypothetical protein
MRNALLAVLVAATVGGAGRATAAGPVATPAAAAGEACRIATRDVVATDAVAVIYRRPQGLFACYRRDGTRTLLVDTTVDGATWGSVALAGRFVAYARSLQPGASGPENLIDVLNLAAGKVREVVNDGEDPFRCGTSGGCGASGVPSLIVRRDGAAAWIACDVALYSRGDQCDVSTDPAFVFSLDSRGKLKQLGVGRRIKVSSLRWSRDRRSVVWISAGQLIHRRVA